MSTPVSLDYSHIHNNSPREGSPWVIYNGDLVIYGNLLEDCKITSQAPDAIEYWYINNNKPHVWNRYWVDIIKFKEEFPVATWKFNQQTGIHILGEQQIAKFKHEFPISIWKLEDLNTEHIMRLSIIYWKDLAKFKKEFPYNIHRIVENYRNYGTVLMTHTDYPETLGAFCNTKWLKIMIIPKQITHISFNTFSDSNLEKIYIPINTIIDNEVFPPNCEVIRYTDNEELKELLNNP